MHLNPRCSSNAVTQLDSADTATTVYECQCGGSCSITCSQGKSNSARMLYDSRYSSGRISTAPYIAVSATWMGRIESTVLHVMSEG